MRTKDLVKCDVCKDEEAGKPKTWGTFSFWPKAGEPQTMDLCEGCTRIIRSWIRVEQADGLAIEAFGWDRGLS